MTYAIAVINVLVFAAGAVIAGGIGGLDFLFAGMVLAFGGTGAVIARRQPRNPIGWMFLAISFAAALAELSGAAASRWETPWIAAYATSSWIPPMLPGLTLLLLLFPDGRLLGPRWRIVAICAGAGIAFELIGSMLRPGPLEDYPQIDNPFGWAGAGAFEALGALCLLVALVGGPVSLVKRFRRAERLERQQIKWLALAGGAAAAAMLLGLAAFMLLPSAVPEAVVYLVMMTGVLALPIAAAVAIVRHRLYDIDVVINRTLVYGALTATLAATYLATVLLAQLVLPARSDLAIAVSTLAVAAAFGPARARIQAAVDRRFFRARYDAARTLVGFGARVRDEVELGALSAELTAIAADTMQPAHVSLWLRER